jgi:hypothetical protein
VEDEMSIYITRSGTGRLAMVQGNTRDCVEGPFRNTDDAEAALQRLLHQQEVRVAHRKAMVAFVGYGALVVAVSWALL